MRSEASGLSPPLEDSAGGADHVCIMAAVDAEGDPAERPYPEAETHAPGPCDPTWLELEEGGGHTVANVAVNGHGSGKILDGGRRRRVIDEDSFNREGDTGVAGVVGVRVVLWEILDLKILSGRGWIHLYIIFYLILSLTLRH